MESNIDMSDLEKYLSENNDDSNDLSYLDYKFDSEENSEDYKVENIEDNSQMTKFENCMKNLSMECSSLQNHASIDVVNINNNNNCDSLETRCDLLEAPPQFEAAFEIPLQKTIFEERKFWVYDLIAKKIGLKWRLFGGGIGMREGDMDNLEHHFDNIATRVHKMFDQLEVKEFYNYDKIYYKITQSLLEECNRTALKDEIEFAMTK